MGCPNFRLPLLFHVTFDCNLAHGAALRPDRRMSLFCTGKWRYLHPYCPAGSVMFRLLMRGRLLEVREGSKGGRPLKGRNMFMFFVLERALRHVVKRGTLLVTDSAGRSHRFGDGEGEPVAFRITDRPGLSLTAASPTELLVWSFG